MATSLDTERLTEQLVQKYGSEKTATLLSYLDLVLDRNEHINLTAVRDRDEAVQKHIADSLSVTDLPEYEKAERVIDIGTGAGFPGALLAVVSPEKEFVLLDSTLKRLKVIDEFADQLGIANINTVHARAEEISRRDEYCGQFDLCVSRAVASLDKLCGWCLPFVRSGGYFISYKGGNYQEELDAAGKSLRKYRGVLERVVPVEGSSDEISGHVLLVIRKK
ncbi:MAG: 16S rRNA (guanine(527)-N(7))-methyltransferase RsmG [Mogibacterium sp.]|nr:16S rRNA (guanine(527)-N(7))-methyltransferase RsmG [Mogibacterium sp.]MBQ6388023.1 16S rRNA (guanine(527)-N(7))-methyltransferase RsmG [Mogibacterium sp.]